MRSAIVLLLSFGLLVVNCTVEETHEKHVETSGPFGLKKHSSTTIEHERRLRDVTKFKMDEPTKEKLVKEKPEHPFFQKAIEYFLNNENTKLDRECFSKIKPGQSIDFVIDLAPSPSHDKVDKVCAEESPIALFLEHRHLSASRAYFGSVEMFIDAVTFDVKPEWTHSVIYDNGRKYFIRGRQVDDEESIKKLQSGGDFADKTRNLRTMWPEPTKESVSRLGPFVKNNLGRMTKLSLWNRDNGLPIVLSSSRRSRPFYTIVISDGSSGVKIHELSDDLSRTTVVDLGNRRFLNNISKEDMKQLGGVYTLTAPQKLVMLADTCRALACRYVEQSNKE